MFWEVGRALSAFLTGMSYPQSVFLSVIYSHFVYHIAILDILAVIDMYVCLQYLVFAILI